MKQDDWPARLTREIIGEIKRQREARKWSAQRLADECKSHGLAISRSTIADLEGGRRAHLGIPEMLVLGRALGVAPLTLIFRVGAAARVEVVPGQMRSPFAALQWAAAERPFPGTDDAGYLSDITSDWDEATGNVTAIYRAHAQAVAEEREALRRAAGMESRAAGAATDMDREEFTAVAVRLRRAADDSRALADGLRRRAAQMGYLPPGG